MKATRLWIALVAGLWTFAGCGQGYYEERLAETDVKLRKGTFRLGATDSPTATEGTPPPGAAGDAPANDPAATPEATPPDAAPPETTPADPAAATPAPTEKPAPEAPPAADAAP